MTSRGELWRADSPPRRARWLLVSLFALAACDGCEDDEAAPIPEAPPPRPERVHLPEVSWPPAFRGVPAPEGAWDDHQLAVDPTTDDTWLASFDSSDAGTVLLSRFTDGGWEPQRLDLPSPMGGSFLRLRFDGEGAPHLLYFRVIGEVDTEGYEAQIVHAFRDGDSWRTETVHSEPRELDRASSTGWLVVDASGEVLFAHRRGRSPPILVRRVGERLESQRLGEEEDEVGEVMAFEVTGARTRFAWTDSTRSKIFVSSTDGPTRELHAFEDFSIRRHVDAVFTPNGELHVVAEHHDNISFFHLVFADHGVRRSSVAPFAQGLAIRPMVGFDEVGALVTHARAEADGSAGELWLTRIQHHLRPTGVEIAPLERDVDQDHLLFLHGPPVVDGEGRVFIGTKGWISGPGTTWTSAP